MAGIEPTTLRAGNETSAANQYPRHRYLQNKRGDELTGLITCTRRHIGTLMGFAPPLAALDTFMGLILLVPFSTSDSVTAHTPLYVN